MYVPTIITRLCHVMLLLNSDSLLELDSRLIKICWDSFVLFCFVKSLQSWNRNNKKYSLTLNKLSITPDMRSFALRANICLNVFRLALAHVSPTETERFLVSHALNNSLLKTSLKYWIVKLKRIENYFIFTLWYVWYLAR